MPQPFESEDKPRKVYHIPLRIDAASLNGFQGYSGLELIVIIISFS